LADEADKKATIEQYESVRYLCHNNKSQFRRAR
jgi:hypothetical protein